MVPRPLILSTPVARGDGAGTIILGPETIDLRIVGRPTKLGLLVSTAPVRLFGTLSYPKIDIRPPRPENKNQVSAFARAGYFIKKLRVGGSDEAKAAIPINCPAEITRALS